MDLTIVGCSGSYPGPDSAASCYLIEAPYEGETFRLVVDLGSGGLGALQRYIDLDTVNAVCLSHLHADHCLDLCGFYVVRKYHPSGHMGSIPVYGPSGTADLLAKAYGLESDPGMHYEFDFTEWDEVPKRIGPFTVETTPVAHPVEAYALRINDGERVLVYSGDTGPCRSLDELAVGCDLLLAEASFVEEGNNPPRLHMTGRQAAETAAKAGAGQLVLTHIPPWHSREQALAEAAPYFSGDMSVAVPGATYKV